MPELPEVETVVRDLRAAGIVGRSITRVSVSWARTVAEPTLSAFKRQLRGRRITAIERRAKYIVLRLDNGQLLLVHLRMTGRLDVADESRQRTPHEHVLVSLDDGRVLRYSDTRKFGRWYLVGEQPQRLATLGPEPLSPAFRKSSFYAALQQHKRMLKPLLLDQTFLAGLGNIYVDEALWAAQLHPCRRSDSLSTEEAALLHRTIRAVLRQGIRSMGTTLGSGETNFYSVAGRRGRNRDGLKVFRRHGTPCPRCATRIERIVVGQRATHICPNCQEDKDSGYPRSRGVAASQDSGNDVTARPPPRRKGRSH